MSEPSRLRIHAQITPENSATAESQPIRWRSIPHPKQRRRIATGGTPQTEKKPPTFGDRMLRNSALACALLLAILAMGNIDQPWAKRASETVERALTMHIDLDDSIGRLTFVRNLLPESALVFLNVSGNSELALPVQGELSHVYSDAQPWLLFSCPEKSAVCAIADGTITAVSEFSGGTLGILIDHGGGMESVYAYLSEASVEVGEAVSRGQEIGQTDAQLYFELREAETAVDASARMGL